ncbi:hypothetical protein BKA69DRAFT_1055436 [Paraphysoderma sedebokerense]|nr:hypothetical protein BKA69DRAFT_1055436 [Paraphysoderma sedebokerense]
MLTWISRLFHFIPPFPTTLLPLFSTYTQFIIPISVQVSWLRTLVIHVFLFIPFILACF